MTARLAPCVKGNGNAEPVRMNGNVIEWQETGAAGGPGRVQVFGNGPNMAGRIGCPMVYPVRETANDGVGLSVFWQAAWYRSGALAAISGSWGRVAGSWKKSAYPCFSQPPATTIWCPGPESNRHGVTTEGF